MAFATGSRRPYVVAWNVVSADSHPVNGAFTFVVGAGADVSDEQVASLVAVPSDTGWRIAAGIGRFASYAGILLAAGGVIFLTVVDRRRPSKRIVQLVTAAAAVGVIGLLVQIPLQAAIATETGWRALRSPSRWIDVLSNSGLRWATFLGVVGAVMVALAVRALASDREQGPAPWFGLAGAAIAFVSFALTGHTRVTSPGWLVIPADAVHVAAAGMWFGGLVLLVVAWTAPAPRRRRGRSGPPRRSLLADGRSDSRRRWGERCLPCVEGGRVALRAHLDPLRVDARREAVRRRIRRRPCGVQPLEARARHPAHRQGGRARDPGEHLRSERGRSWRGQDDALGARVAATRDDGSR